jgi:hypothetical protein
MDFFGKMCCAAQDAAGQAGEVITTAKAGAYDKAKTAADSFMLGKLKDAMEGSKVQEWVGPDVWVEIKQVDLGEGVDVASMLNFSLKGVKVKTQVEIVGTAAQLAGMVTAGGAKAAAEKVGAAEAALKEKLGLPSLGIGSYIADAAAGAKEKLATSASSGVETKATDFDLEVDLEKVLGVEAVKSKVKIVGASSDAITKYIGDSVLQLYVEDAISRRVSSIVTDWQNATAKDATGKVAEAADRAKETAAEAADKAKAKASELAATAEELAKAKGLKK